MRLGLITPGEGDYDMTGWRHLKCAPAGPLVVSEEETVTAAAHLEGWCDMEEAEQAVLVKWFEEEHGPDSAPADAREDATKNSSGHAETAVPEASSSAAEDAPPPPPRGTYLAVPFKDKAQAQQLGAKWDARKQKWFVPFSVALDAFSAWFGPEADADAVAAHAAVFAAQAAEAAEAAAAEAMDVADEGEEGDADRIEPSEVAGMKVGELKDALERRGLEAAGKRAELVERLTTALAERTSRGRRRVDRAVPGGAAYTVHGEYDVKLLQSDISAGHNRCRMHAA